MSDTPEEAATPDDVPETCELDGCDDAIGNFPEAFPVPPEILEEADDAGRLVMCDGHHVASRVLAYTRPDPPFVDVGLYAEVTAYSRQLAAAMLEYDDPTSVVNLSGGGDDDE